MVESAHFQPFGEGKASLANAKPGFRTLLLAADAAGQVPARAAVDPRHRLAA